MTGIITLPGRVTIVFMRGFLYAVKAALLSVVLLPRMVKKPKVLLLWLGRSHFAQALLVASLFVMFGMAPNITDQLFDKIFQPVQQLGAEPTNITGQPHNINELKAQAQRSLQYGCGVLALLAFWLSIPAAVRRGEAIAMAKEKTADELVGTSPSRSVILYRQALTFATDATHTKTLWNNLTALDREVWEAAPEVETSAPRLSSASSDLGERYETRGELGQGAMGVVLLAHDTVLEREVAIKELPRSVANDPKLMERFKREALALARLNHSGIVQVYDFLQFEGSAWIVMEYVSGSDLEKISDKTGQMAPAEVVRLARGMAAALEYAHVKGVLHRDLKPSNVMVDSLEQPKIMDFGVAQLAMSSSYTQPGTIMGSPSYMSPEQAQGEKVSAKTDIYSLGAMLYSLLAGERMIKGTMTEAIAQVLHQEPTPIRKIAKKTPLKLAKLVMSMVAKKQAARPASMAEVLKTLESIRVKT